MTKQMVEVGDYVIVQSLVTHMQLVFPGAMYPISDSALVNAEPVNLFIFFSSPQSDMGGSSVCLYNREDVVAYLEQLGLQGWYQRRIEANKEKSAVRIARGVQNAPDEPDDTGHPW